MERYLQLQDLDLGHRLDPEVLLSLGEQAARMHAYDGRDLTEAVLEVVGGKALNPAHVSRVVETANQKAYLFLYDMSTGPTRVVRFKGGPARIFEILDQVFGGGDKNADENADEEEPDMTRKAAGLDFLVAPSTPTGEMSKAASAAPRKAHLFNTNGGRMYVYEQVKTAAEAAAQDVAGLTARLAESADTLVKLASEAMKEGYTPPQIARVMWGRPKPTVEEMREHTKQAAWQAVVTTMAKLGQNIKLSSIPWDRTPAKFHPLTIATGLFAKTAVDLWKKTAEADELQAMLAIVRRKMEVQS